MTSGLYAAERRGGGETIVLLHGFGSCHGVWDSLVATLGETSIAIAYDLPGHGRALGHPDAGSATRTGQAILADLAAREVEKFHLAGHSMGGAVAVLMALAAPGRIASLTLLAPGGFGETINAPLLRRYADAVENAELRACLTAMSGPGSLVADSVVETCRAMRSRPGQPEKLAEIVQAITRGGRQGVIPHERLATLAMPVTIIWGTADPVLPVAQADGLPSHFRRHLVPRAGHMLIHEASGLVAGLVRSALTQPAT